MLQVTYLEIWLVFMLGAVTAYLTGNITPFTSLALSILGLGLVYGLALWSVLDESRESHSQQIMH